jgi:hypothetical protein
MYAERAANPMATQENRKFDESPQTEQTHGIPPFTTLGAPHSQQNKNAP